MEIHVNEEECPFWLTKFKVDYPQRFERKRRNRQMGHMCLYLMDVGWDHDLTKMNDLTPFECNPFSTHGLFSNTLI